MYVHYPQTRGRVAYADIGTPLTNDFYLGSVRGEVYGLDHSWQRFSTPDALRALHPQTAIPGLYLSGEDSTSVGVPSAMLAGVFTAARVSYSAALRGVVEMLLA